MNSENTRPEVYGKAELDCLELHIETHLGAFEQVFHEISSPDIHVDIAVIPPTAQHNYHTLVTMGMGAHRMNVPSELDQYHLDRAELMICLPPDWNLRGQSEVDYWPLRWLKMLARLPGNDNTWLGWGHTIPAGEPFAESTKLCGTLLLSPGMFGAEAARCTMPDGSVVNFYQLIPLYQDEIDFKLDQGTEALLKRMPDEALEVVDINRPSFGILEPEKLFALKAEDLKPLLPDWEGGSGCIATHRITVDGCRVGYLYREDPGENNKDSGWRFAAGDEPPEYWENPENLSAYHLNTICNCDREIIPLLTAPYGTSYFRDSNGAFHRE